MSQGNGVKLESGFCGVGEENILVPSRGDQGCTPVKPWEPDKSKAI